MSEPLFNDIQKGNKEMQQAYDLAAKTIKIFIDSISDDFDSVKMAKLQFVEPDTKDTEDENIFYIWLTNVYYHHAEKIFSGDFFEVPHELQEFHSPGERLGFDADDIFDWMTIDEGHACGGFTLRVARSRKETEEDKKEFDEYVGIESYEPMSNYITP